MEGSGYRVEGVVPLELMCWTLCGGVWIPDLARLLCCVLEQNA